MPGKQAAPTKTNHPNLAAGLLRRVVNGSLNVLHHTGAGQVGSGGLQAHACGHVVWLVAQVHAGGDAFKHGGCNGQVALGGKAIRHGLYVRVDTEDLLNHNDSCFGFTSRLGQVGRDCKAVGGFEVNELAHVLSPVGKVRCYSKLAVTQEAALSKVLLITGGSRGIGAATALLAAGQGYAVAVNYAANSLAADEVVRQIRASGGNAITVQADVAIETDVLAMFKKVDAKLGRLTALVNNAGVVDMTSRVDAMSLERLQRMFAINVFGSFMCAREAVKRMSTRYEGEGGAIVNVSSAAARLGAPGQYVDYAAAKGAIDTFTVGLAKELATEGIRVNAVRPGIIETEIHASGGLPNRVRELGPQVPMQRAGTAAEVAEAIVWLLGENSSYTTGTLLDVSGGR